MKLQYHGHSCWQIITKDFNLIIDPFLNGNRFAKVSVKDLKVDYVLVTHGHGDHLGDTEELAKQNNATVIAPYELSLYLAKKGVKVHPMHIGGGYSFPFGKVKLTPALHGSSVEENGEIIYTGMPCGYLLTIEGKTIYHAGDTALFRDMKTLGELYKIDLALLPIGDNFTMGIDDAVTAATFLQAKKVIPMHFQTFEIINVNPQEFITKLKAKGIAGEIVDFGQIIEI